MSPVWVRARAELRSQWGTALALTLLVGLVGGVVVASAAGARRTASAFDRFLDASHAAHVTVQAFGADPALIEQIEGLPQVAAAAPAAFLLVRPVGDDLEPGLQFSAAASVDGRFLRAVDRPRILEGRPPDPARVDEVAINEALAERRGLEVGDQLAFEWLTPEQRDRIFAGEDPGPLAGPTEPLTVVAIQRFPYDLGQGELFVTPASVTPSFYRAYRDRIAAFDGIVAIRLRRGEADVAAFTRAVGVLSGGGPEVQVLPASRDAAKVTDAMDVLATGLVVFGATAGLAGLVAVGMALARQAAATAIDQPALAALGMTRAERTGAKLGVGAAVAGGGAVLTVAVAVAASPLLPVGLARLAEPDLGVSVDGAALATGFLATAALVMALAGAAAWRSSRLATSPAAAVPQPAEVANLQRVADLPAVLGGFLGLLATLAVGHGIVSGVRRRRRDLGVLQAMGFVRLQVSAAVAWQASILALVGATAGLPLGVAFGRWAWLVLAGPMGVVPAPVVPTLAVLFAVPAAVLVANLVALLPARVATRMPPAAALRAE